MKKIIVCSRDVVPKHIKNSNIDSLISITDPGDPLPEEIYSSVPKVLLLAMPDEIDYGIMLDYQDQVKKLLDITEEFLNGEGTLLVHCNAGYSRSPAAAYILCVKSGMEPEEALEYTLDACDNYSISPNRALIKMAIAFMGIDLISPVDKWLKEKHNIWKNHEYSGTIILPWE